MERTYDTGVPFSTIIIYVEYTFLLFFIIIDDDMFETRYFILRRGA